MTVIDNKKIKSIRSKHGEEKIVFCHGTFDLTHAGHVLLLKEAKSRGDILVVTVTNDKAVKKNKGDQRPILSQEIRLDMVDAIKPVDYCFLDKATDKQDSLSVLEEIFLMLKPDIYVINEDTFNITERENLCKKHGIKMHILKRWCKPEYDNISTTKIIEKIRKMKFD